MARAEPKYTTIHLYLDPPGTQLIDTFQLQTPLARCFARYAQAPFPRRGCLNVHVKPDVAANLERDAAVLGYTTAQLFTRILELWKERYPNE